MGIQGDTKTKDGSSLRYEILPRVAKALKISSDLTSPDPTNIYLYV